MDAWIEQVLLRAGVVAGSAIRHARALQQRGFEHCALDELLLDLGHVTSETLVPLYAAATGAAVWDEDELDLDLAEGHTVDRRALPVRRSNNCVFYATTVPYDEGLRDQVRFALSAGRAEPLVASEWALVRARRRSSTGAGLTESAESALEQPLTPAELQLRWRDEEASGVGDAPLCRLTNILLIEHVLAAAGARLRLRDFDSPGLDLEDAHCAGDAACWRGIPSALVGPVSRRLQYMATRDAVAEEADGWITLQLGRRGRCFTARLRARRTSRGRVVVVQREAPWMGLWPTGPAWAPWREAVRLLAPADAAGDDRKVERAAHAAMHAADEIGEPAFLEQVSSREDLARFLIGKQRDHEARPVLERALELARAHGLGPRVEGQLQSLLADACVDDLAERVQIYAEAHTRLSLPGPGSQPTAGILRVLAFAQDLQGNHEAALETTERALAEDESWFGAWSRDGAFVLVDASKAHAALGQLDAAREKAEQARALVQPLGLDPLPAAWMLARIAAHAGDVGRATVELGQALAESGPESDVWPLARAELALMLEQTAMLAEAKRVAEETLPLLAFGGAVTQALRASLEGLLRRAGPYR